MLDREVCARCHDKTWYAPAAQEKDINLKGFDAWACPIMMAKPKEEYIRYTNENDNPPAGCPYALEHGVSEAAKGKA
jgi:hypothetical protein